MRYTGKYIYVATAVYGSGQTTLFASSDWDTILDEAVNSQVFGGGDVETVSFNDTGRPDTWYAIYRSVNVPTIGIIVECVPIVW